MDNYPSYIDDGMVSGDSKSGFPYNFFDDGEGFWSKKERESYVRCMQNKLTFLLSIATTSAFAMFGCISAFYSEVTKEGVAISKYIVTFDTIGVLGTGFFTIQCFRGAYLLAKKKKKRM